MAIRSCERCGARVESTTAYKQKEWTRIGGAKVQINAYYCAHCAQLLQGIGTGEHTDMQARAAEVPSREPYTKGESDDGCD